MPLPEHPARREQGVPTSGRIVSTLWAVSSDDRGDEPQVAKSPPRQRPGRPASSSQRTKNGNNGSGGTSRASNRPVSGAASTTVAEPIDPVLDETVPITLPVVAGAAQSASSEGSSSNGNRSNGNRSNEGGSSRSRNGNSEVSATNEASGTFPSAEVLAEPPGTDSASVESLSKVDRSVSEIELAGSPGPDLVDMFEASRSPITGPILVQPGASATGPIPGPPFVDGVLLAQESTVLQPRLLIPEHPPYATPRPSNFDARLFRAGPVPLDPALDPDLPQRPTRLKSVHLPSARRRGRPRLRRVTRIVRHVDPWSVFKVALCFSFVLYGVCLTAGVLLWNVAYTTGTIDNIQRFFESFGWNTFRFKGGELFHNAWIAGVFCAIGMTGLIVLAATLFNLITDLVGGIRVTVLEEEVIERDPALRSSFLRRRSRHTSSSVPPRPGQDDPGGFHELDRFDRDSADSSRRHG